MKRRPGRNNPLPGRNLPLSLIERRRIRNRQRKLEYSAARGICLGPQATTVSFDYRAADRQTYAETLWFSRIKSIKKRVEALGIHARSRICDRYCRPVLKS